MAEPAEVGPAVENLIGLANVTGYFRHTRLGKVVHVRTYVRMLVPGDVIKLGSSHHRVVTQRRLTGIKNPSGHHELTLEKLIPEHRTSVRARKKHRTTLVLHKNFRVTKVQQSKNHPGMPIVERHGV